MFNKCYVTNDNFNCLVNKIKKKIVNSKAFLEEPILGITKEDKIFLRRYYNSLKLVDVLNKNVNKKNKTLKEVITISNSIINQEYKNMFEIVKKYNDEDDDDNYYIIKVLDKALINKINDFNFIARNIYCVNCPENFLSKSDIYMLNTEHKLLLLCKKLKEKKLTISEAYKKNIINAKEYHICNSELTYNNDKDETGYLRHLYNSNDSNDSNDSINSDNHYYYTKLLEKIMRKKKKRANIIKKYGDNKLNWPDNLYHFYLLDRKEEFKRF